MKRLRHFPAIGLLIALSVFTDVGTSAELTRLKNKTLGQCLCEVAGDCRCSRKWNIRFLDPKTGAVWGSYSADSKEELQKKVEDLRQLEADLREQFGDKPSYHDFDQSEGPYCIGCATDTGAARDAFDSKVKDQLRQIIEAIAIYKKNRGVANPFKNVGLPLGDYGNALADVFKKLSRARHQLLDSVATYEDIDAELSSVANELDKAIAPLQPVLRSQPSPTPMPAGSAAQIIAAAKTGSVADLETLLKSGANLNGADENGYTALMWAVRSGHGAAAEFLIKNGGLVNAKASDGYTPLMFAASRNDEAMVRFLLANGADKKAKQSSGFTAFDIAGGAFAKPSMARLLK